MPERVVVDECPRCQFEPFWDGYELRCPNCDYLIGIRDTVTKTNTAFVQHNQEFHAAFRDACTVLMQLYEKHADVQPMPVEFIEGHHWAREQAEESDDIAAGAEHHQEWLHDILKR
jgi:Fe-S-cluster formation regulator IscX/YfhJ